MKPDSSPQPPPQDPTLDRALALHEAGQIAQARSIYRELLRASPRNADLLRLLGTAECQLGDLEAGARLLGEALEIAPDQPAAHYNRGNALKGLGRLEAAIASYDRAIALRPGDASAQLNRGVALFELGRFAEALASGDRVITLRPDHADAHANRGNALMRLGRLDEAVASLDRAIALRPDRAEAFSSRGSALLELGRRDAARASFDRAIALDPGHARAHANKAQLDLLEGRFREGWASYEWRWKAIDGRVKPAFATPPWLGQESLAGSTLLIHPEQGLGDFVQFCRYAPMARALGAGVVLQVPPPLVSLVATLPGGYNVIPQGQPLPRFDFHCPVMSLPRAFDTTLATIPAQVPYLFASAAKVAAWRTRLGPRRRPRVGIAWSGSAIHKNDRNRSIALAAFAPLLELPLEFHALQKEIRAQDTAFLAQAPRVRLHADALHDFSDTAALIAAMDLVISVDTSVAHVAGAMGRPVWILLPFVPDFRWMLDRADSPWYPTARLFRQASPGDWGRVIKGVAARLARS